MRFFVDFDIMLGKVLFSGERDRKRLGAVKNIKMEYFVQT